MIYYPPSGMPALSNDPRAPQVTIPEEILQFYRLCGGLESVIRRDEDLFLSIVPPNKFSWTVKEILGASLSKQQELIKDNIGWNWYTIGRGDTDEYFVVDLAPERFGHCYFVQFYFFLQQGWTPRVALSFQELLEQFLKAAFVGENWSWKNTGLGDAYVGDMVGTSTKTKRQPSLVGIPLEHKDLAPASNELPFIKYDINDEVRVREYPSRPEVVGLTGKVVGIRTWLDEEGRFVYKIHIYELDEAWTFHERQLEPVSGERETT